MSVRLMSAIFDSETLAPTERLIMLSLADHADDNGRCYPSVARICQRTGLSERAVQTNIRKLESQGYIRIVPGGGKGNVNLYFVHPNPAVDAPPQQMHTKPRSRCTPAADAPQTPQQMRANPAADAPEPSRTIIGSSVESAGARQTSAPEAHDALPPTDRELVLEAMGFGPDGVVSPGRMIGGQGDMAELRRWLDLPGMTLPIIIDEIRRIAGSKPDGPVASFKYFTPAMTRLSGQLTAPRLIPTPYAHQPQQDGPYERFNRPRQAAADRRQDRPDPALEQIARLAGLGRAPGDVGD